MDDAAQRRRWDDRHAAATPLAPPSSFVARHVSGLRDAARRQRALDVACGGGRHTRLLVAAGFTTVALDASLAAVRRASASRGALGVVADARALPFRSQSFDLIVSTCFLERAAFAPMSTLLRPSGYLLVETFRRIQHERTGHPRAEFCLTDGELEALCLTDATGLRHVDSHRSEPGPDGRPPALAGLLARRG